MLNEFIDKSSNTSVKISDKSLIAQCVVKLFPLNIEDLKKEPELFEYVEKLVQVIKKANLEE